MAKDYPTPLIVPIDRTAARVVSKGTHFNAKGKIDTPLWDAPPPTQPVPTEYKDLIGTKQDRMTIVGFLSGTSLLARCVCGKYEPRKASVWRKMRGVNENKCQHCNYLRFIKRQADFDRSQSGR